MSSNRALLASAGAVAAIAIVGLAAFYRSAARERDRLQREVQALRGRAAVPPRAALEHAAKNDPDDRVRRQASASLVD